MPAATAALVALAAAAVLFLLLHALSKRQGSEGEWFSETVDLPDSLITRRELADRMSEAEASISKAADRATGFVSEGHQGIQGLMYTDQIDDLAGRQWFKQELAPIAKTLDVDADLAQRFGNARKQLMTAAQLDRQYVRQSMLDASNTRTQLESEQVTIQSGQLDAVGRAAGRVAQRRDLAVALEPRQSIEAALAAPAETVRLRDRVDDAAGEFYAAAASISKRFGRVGADALSGVTIADRTSARLRSDYMASLQSLQEMDQAYAKKMAAAAVELQLAKADATQRVASARLAAADASADARRFSLCLVDSEERRSCVTASHLRFFQDDIIPDYLQNIDDVRRLDEETIVAMQRSKELDKAAAEAATRLAEAQAQAEAARIAAEMRAAEELASQEARENAILDQQKALAAAAYAKNMRDLDERRREALNRELVMQEEAVKLEVLRRNIALDDENDLARQNKLRSELAELQSQLKSVSDALDSSKSRRVWLESRLDQLRAVTRIANDAMSALRKSHIPDPLNTTLRDALQGEASASVAEEKARQAYQQALESGLSDAMLLELHKLQQAAAISAVAAAQGIAAMCISMVQPQLEFLVQDANNVNSKDQAQAIIERIGDSAAEGVRQQVANKGLTLYDAATSSSSLVAAVWAANELRLQAERALSERARAQLLVGSSKEVADDRQARIAELAIQMPAMIEEARRIATDYEAARRRRLLGVAMEYANRARKHANEAKASTDEMVTVTRSMAPPP